MEVVLFVLIVLSLLVLLDLAALKWGGVERPGNWLEGGYDPRWNWQYPEQDALKKS